MPTVNSDDLRPPPAGPPPAPPKRARLRPAKSIGTVVILAALIGLLVWQRQRLADLPALLLHARWGWVGLAVLAQGTSIGALAREQRRLLSVRGGRLSLPSVLATTYAGTAISVSLPLVGSAAATVFTFRRFTAIGVDRAAAAWALAVSGVYSTVTLAAITSTGALLSGSVAAAITGAVTILAGVLPVTLLLVTLHRPGVRARVLKIVDYVLAWSHRTVGRPHGDTRAAAATAIGQLASLRLSRRSTILAALSAFLNWGADIACLVCAIVAVDGRVPWTFLILAWAAGAGVSSLGLTPGGLGVVEATLGATLIAAGLPAGTAVAAVLIYRAVKLWLVLAIGAIALLVIRQRPRRRQPADGTVIARQRDQS